MGKSQVKSTEPAKEEGKRSAKTAQVNAVESKKGGRKKQKVESEENAEEQIDYASKDYWNERYCTPCAVEPSSSAAEPTKESILAHEWYYTFDDLAPLIFKQEIFQKRSSEISSIKILEVGCGNQPLLPSFLTYQNEDIPSEFVGENLYGFDFSDKVIQQLQRDSNGIHYECKDARKLDYISDSFDIIIDKGTMDAMLSEKNREKGVINAKLMVKEMIRLVTRKHGLVMVVSHIEPDTEEFSVLVEEIMMPSLQNEKEGVIWKLHVHGAGGEAQGGTVYCLTCTEKRVTRTKNTAPNEIFVEFFEYGDSEDDEEDGDEEEEEEEEVVKEIPKKRKK